MLETKNLKKNAEQVGRGENSDKTTHKKGGVVEKAHQKEVLKKNLRRWSKLKGTLAKEHYRKEKELVQSKCALKGNRDELNWGGEDGRKRRSAEFKGRSMTEKIR